MKAINGTYDILNIHLVTPRIHAIVHRERRRQLEHNQAGAGNRANNNQKRALALKLRKYSIEEGYIEYKDEQGKMHAIIVNLNHKGTHFKRCIHVKY